MMTTYFSGLALEDAGLFPLLGLALDIALLNPIFVGIGLVAALRLVLFGFLDGGVLFLLCHYLPLRYCSTACSASPRLRARMTLEMLC